eukprot:2874220-Rhodomonas_salina.3
MVLEIQVQILDFRVPGNAIRLNEAIELYRTSRSTPAATPHQIQWTAIAVQRVLETIVSAIDVADLTCMTLTCDSSQLTE